MNSTFKFILIFSYLFVSFHAINSENTKSVIKNHIFQKDQVKIIEYARHPYRGITITNDNVERAERIFKNYLHIVDPKLLNKLNLYKRQYVGIQSQGKRIVYINFAKIVSPWTQEDWERELFFSFDGGGDYMNVKVNIDDEFCYDFSINGDA
ncbi:hypothetical protein MAL01_19175 (plasmid) [Leptospira noguchii]|uniref:hypothetical protein n=1 Tax=Leptospira noguchii TaxID=28182 RepID=UPI001FB80941|nr:hypothetical protein [Leptospira noguchii]UOG36235.1 hypothetical protein MAL02_18775 [Leptospira noguchii]UOG47198.1 hypothetical protein MAL01_19175 [Leptospira noguchii]